MTENLPAHPQARQVHVCGTSLRTTGRIVGQMPHSRRTRAQCEYHGQLRKSQVRRYRSEYINRSGRKPGYKQVQDVDSFEIGDFLHTVLYTLKKAYLCEEATEYASESRSEVRIELAFHTEAAMVRCM